MYFLPVAANYYWQFVHRVNDSDEEESGINANTKSEVGWGLSESSCNLAKELLSVPQLNLAESEENLLSSNVESKEGDDDKEAEKKVDVSHPPLHITSCIHKLTRGGRGD